MISPLLNRLATRLDSIIDWSGRTVSWLTLGMVVVMFCVVVLRFVFDLGWVWLQEIVNYLHAYVFMIGAAYTLQHGAHVRVDVFYRDMTPQRKAVVDLLGTLFLLFPVCGFIFYASWSEVITSWQELEPSQRTGGLNFAYLLKSSMLIMPALLILQGLIMAIKNALCLAGVTPTNEENS